VRLRLLESANRLNEREVDLARDPAAAVEGFDVGAVRGRELRLARETEIELALDRLSSHLPARYASSA